MNLFYDVHLVANIEYSLPGQYLPSICASPSLVITCITPALAQKSQPDGHLCLPGSSRPDL